MDGAFLAQAKAAGDEHLLSVVKAEADEAMRDRLRSVMEKKAVPPSGDKHDYMSLGTYWWPNPATPNHLPYIRKDGQHNPEASQAEDHVNFGKMSSHVRSLALAYYLTDDEKYARRASLLLRVWFLDPATHMNPNLKFAQAIRGLNDGRGIGIIDTRGMADVVDGLAMLGGSHSWTNAEDTALHAWFSEYFKWLTTSENGVDEDSQKNNHGNWYDVQASAIAMYLGKTQFVHDRAETMKKKRIELQIEPDGAQPLEEARTNSFGYSTMSLEALTKMASMAQMVGVDLWNYKSPRGGSMRGAFDYLTPFALKQKAWKHETINGFKPEELQKDLLPAAIAYHDASYEAAAKTLGRGDDAQSLLWQMEFNTISKTGAKAR